ncbi:Single-stranded DNA-binding protein [Neolewinella maritima]|uniref:Single-stranded DNA-binding protein n=1 Tax=Neolewinella maritima TaxID=1383882 RepID=A0ABN8F0W9_9BACT|nr:single-stranded DNA-binding protein [Neolewinella maritima]CAH1000269.1 Single-stranded DNA-binding protein [Neolewinella maritima]
MLLSNHIQLIGRVGHDPELVSLTDGTPRANLRIYQDAAASEQPNETQVHTLIGWHNLAHQLQARVRRGDTVLVQGRLVNRKLLVNGHVLIKSEVHLSEFRVLSSRSITRNLGLAAEPVHTFHRNHE